MTDTHNDDALLAAAHNDIAASPTQDPSNPPLPTTGDATTEGGVTALVGGLDYPRGSFSRTVKTWNFGVGGGDLDGTASEAA